MDFACRNVGASCWCGSSGSSGYTAYVVVDGVSYQSRGWKPFSVTKNDAVFVMLAKSGGACGTQNGAPCYDVTVWDKNGAKFNSVRT